MEQLKTTFYRFSLLLLVILFSACSAHPIPRTSETEAAASAFLTVYHPTAIVVSSQSWDATTARFVAVVTVTLTGPDGKSKPKTFENTTLYLLRTNGQLAVDKTISPLAPFTVYYELQSQMEYRRTHSWQADPWNAPPAGRK